MTEHVWQVSTFDEEPSISEFGPVAKVRSLKLVASQHAGASVILYAGRMLRLNDGSRKWLGITLWDWTCVGSIFADRNLERQDQALWLLVRGLASGSISGATADELAAQMQAMLLSKPDTLERLLPICPTLVKVCSSMDAAKHRKEAGADA